MEGYNVHKWQVDELITDTKLNNMEEGIQGAHLANDENKTTIEKINTSIQTINSIIESLNSAIETLNTELQGLDTKINSINSTVTELNSGIETLETAMPEKLTKPEGNGGQGQIIVSNGDGTFSYIDMPEATFNGGEVKGNITATGNMAATVFLASQGDEGHGYTFQGEEDGDTGMFSDEDGVLYFMQNYDRFYLDDFAQLESPTFTGQPKAPTPQVTDNSKRIATTAFVQNAIEQLKAELQAN